MQNIMFYHHIFVAFSITLLPLCKAFRTGFESLFTPSISTVQTSPSVNLETPEGVPVAIISPKFKVICLEIYFIINGTVKNHF